MTKKDEKVDEYKQYETDWKSAEISENFDMEKHVSETWNWFDNTLGKPKHILAPMVDASELPWRVLSRRYDTDLCYTPMLHASNFIKDNTYRKENFPIDGDLAQGHPEYDRPLFVQFCANDKDIFAEACKMVEDRCDAVDLNLGCPQMIAKRGHYGSHMQEDWSLIRNMIEQARKVSKIRITAKIRRFEEDDTTLRYAEMLQKAGVSVLTIHGRTRDQRGPNTGLADWKIIKKVKDRLKIPVFANGNIQCLEHVEECLRETGVDGVMTAEGNLYNPCIFGGINPMSGKVALEYITYRKKHQFCTLSACRGHIFKMFHHIFLIEEYHDQRDILGSARSFDDIESVVLEVNRRLNKYSVEDLTSPKNMDGLLELPYWRCKPYVRPANNGDKLPRKRPGETIAQNQQRKLRKAEKVAKYHEKALNKQVKTKYPVCSKCPSNPRGLKCEFELCRSCCRSRLFGEDITCPSHKMFSRKDVEIRKKQQIEYEAKLALLESAES